MKLALKIIGGFVLFTALAISTVFYLTGDMADQADTFFAEVKKGNIDSTYAGLSQGFKKATSLPAFKEFLKVSSLGTVIETSWSSRSINTNTGKIEGTVTTESGQAIPLRVDFVKEDGDWKIFGMRKPTPGAKTDNGTPAAPALALKVPGNDQLVQLVRGTMQAFGASIDAKNMSNFHAHISNLWRSQYTTEKLEEAYGKLYKMGAKWSTLQNLSPIFEVAPAINEKGILVVSGYYPTTPDLLTFSQKYIMEGSSWKLFGLNINFREREQQKK